MVGYKPPKGYVQPDRIVNADTILRGGSIVDGAGKPAYEADIAIKHDRIAEIGDLRGMTARIDIPASGFTITPGFIDVHTHDDRALLSDPGMLPKTSQGVTTVVTGNCGVSLAPLTLGPDEYPVPPLNLLGEGAWWRFDSFAAYARELRGKPPAVNVVMLCGHTSLRVAAMDDLDRAAAADEIGAMGERLEEAMEAGCVGLSTGLAYAPAAAAPTEEVIALARIAGERGGIYATHLRNESDKVIEAIEEALDIGWEAGVRVLLSHHKCAGRANWGRSVETLALIEEARREQPVDLDVYPYAASSTILTAKGAAESEKVLIAWSTPEPDMAGKYLHMIARQWKCGIDEAVDRLSPAGAVYFAMDEADLRRILTFPRTMIGSDGLPHDQRPHPRLWGAFARVLGHYVRNEGLMTIEEAVHRMTALPAAMFGLEDRGEIRAGAFADLCVFDSRLVIDRADFENPVQMANGVGLTLVNGQQVFADRQWTGERPGRVLRRTE